MEYNKIIVDRPIEYVQRITLNHVEKRNALTNELRREMWHALETGDVDDEVRVTIIRGAGPGFSTGYDLLEGATGANEQGQPFYTTPGLTQWGRHLVESCIRMWDWANRSFARYTASASQGLANWPRAVILCMSLKMRRLAIPSCATAHRQTCRSSLVARYATRQ